MPPKKKYLQQKTCFKMGLIAAVVGALAAFLMLFTAGPAQLFLTISFVMSGAMLLFLALAMKGPAHKSLRARLLGLFFMLLLSSFGLPLFCPALEMLVLPLLGILFYQVGDKRHLVFLCFAELAYALCRTLALTSLFGKAELAVVAVSLLLVSAARFWVLMRMHHRAEEAPTAPF